MHVIHEARGSDLRRAESGPLIPGLRKKHDRSPSTLRRIDSAFLIAHVPSQLPWEAIREQWVGARWTVRIDTVDRYGRARALKVSLFMLIFLDLLFSLYWVLDPTQAASSLFFAIGVVSTRFPRMWVLECQFPTTLLRNSVAGPIVCFINIVRQVADAQIPVISGDLIDSTDLQPGFRRGEVGTGIESYAASDDLRGRCTNTYLARRIAEHPRRSSRPIQVGEKLVVG